MAVDLSGLSYFSPIIAFLLVGTVSFAVLLKTKIFGEHKGGLLFLSFIIATLFIFLGGARSYVETVVPWFAVLLVSFAFVMILVGFAGNVPKWFSTGIGVFFISVMLLVFLISGIIVFSDNLAPYIPGSIEYGSTPGSSWLYSSNVLGAVLLLVVAGLASAVLLNIKK